MKTILVIGGAGYIGSHTALLMAQQGHRIIILDSLVHKHSVSFPWATDIFVGDFGDKSLLESVFSKYKIDAIMHFAAFIEVGESVKDPARFYSNNVIKTIQLLDVMRNHSINKIIFSSSCAVYGNPVRIPIDEAHSTNPVSPYGRTKLAIEFALQDYASAYNLKYVALRYFNAAGSLYEYHLGEFHIPETHIIPILLRAAKEDRKFTIFGDDYNTPDGTCIRDYIHVLDIARAHAQSYDYLNGGGGESQVFNLGTGRGYSVKEIVGIAEEITNKKIQINYSQRRVGDADILVADGSLIKLMLDWKPEYSDMKYILNSAWKWENLPVEKFKKKESLNNLFT